MKADKQKKRKSIAGFLAAHSFAVVGVSADRRKFGNALFRTMCEKGLPVVPVHNVLDRVEENKCYRSVRDLRGKVEAVAIAVPPAETERVVQECADAGVQRIWMAKGSGSARAIGRAQELGIDVVHDECLMMFLEPVRSVHAVHRWAKKLVGRYPAPTQA